MVNEHTLVVTKDVEEQGAPLNAKDLQSFWGVIVAQSGLGYYNSGRLSGASQPHKHMQVIPAGIGRAAANGAGVATCTTDDTPVCPVHTLVMRALTQRGDVAGERQCADSVGTDDTFCVPEFPFVHACVGVGDVEHLSASCSVDTCSAGAALERKYRALLHRVGLPCDDPTTPVTPDQSYNVLLTTAWMMVVPRVAECSGPVSINSMGFACTMFVKNDDHLDYLKDHGPLRILQDVTRANP